MDRAADFIQLFNRVEKYLSQLVNPEKFLPFWKLVDVASNQNAAVRANTAALKQFAMLRNAILHDADYPPHIVAVPSEEALLKFTRVVQEVTDPDPLIPTFEARLHCFNYSDTLITVLDFMRKHDFSQVLVTNSEGRLRMLTVEGITKWFADHMGSSQNSAYAALLDGIMALEPPGSFIIMGPDKTIFDAADAFRNSIHSEATRLYAIVITESGCDESGPIGLVTPWDLVHNPKLQKREVDPQSGN